MIVYKEYNKEDMQHHHMDIELHISTKVLEVKHGLKDQEIASLNKLLEKSQKVQSKELAQ